MRINFPQEPSTHKWPERSCWPVQRLSFTPPVAFGRLDRNVHHGRPRWRVLHVEWLSAAAGRERFRTIGGLCDCVAWTRSWLRADGWRHTLGSPFTSLEPLRRAVQIPCRTPPSYPQAPVSGHELGGV